MLTTPSRLVSIASAISGTADPRGRDYHLAVSRASVPGLGAVRSLPAGDRVTAEDMQAVVNSPRGEDMRLADSRRLANIEAVEDSYQVVQVPAQVHTVRHCSQPAVSDKV